MIFEGLNREASDVILHTSDDAYIKAHKKPLMQASPVFTKLFSTPPPEGYKSYVPNAIPRFEIPETSDAMAGVLEFVYPNSKDPWYWKKDETPNVVGIKCFREFYRIADKYDMSQVKLSIIKIFDSPPVVQALPAHCYLFATHTGNSGLELRSLEKIAEGTTRVLDLGKELVDYVDQGHLSTKELIEVLCEFDGMCLLHFQ